MAKSSKPARTVKQFVARHNITMTVEWVDTNPNMIGDDDWKRTASHYRCTLRLSGRRMTVYYSMGSAHTSEPTASDVLSCLIDDMATTDVSFEDWAGDYGYDVGSIKALKTFKLCQKQGAKLAKLLGPDLVAELLDCERD